MPSETCLQSNSKHTYEDVIGQPKILLPTMILLQLHGRCPFGSGTHWGHKL